MSLEKRLMMRPCGVSWKKLIGARSTAVSMVVYSLLAALNPYTFPIKSRPVIMTTVQRLSATYGPKKLPSSSGERLAVVQYASQMGMAKSAASASKYMPKSAETESVPPMLHR